VTPKIPIAAVTDEFSQDLAIALDAMASIGMRAAELRSVGGKNIVDLDRDELQRAKDLLDEKGFRVVAIASPLLKCTLPGGLELDTRYPHDSFASSHKYEDQQRLVERVFDIAAHFRASIVRVFSYWRTVEPDRTFDPIVRALEKLAAEAGQHGITLALENEHACNIATALEAGRVLRAVSSPSLQLVWDPANCLVAGEVPFPDGYRLLPAGRIAHVHAKDVHVEDHRHEWGPLGTRSIDWKGQIAALLKDGYVGHISLETHWPGPNGDKLQASIICGWNLRGLASA
jgi:L-ribulose-5-phosphate 3-epimerase